MSFNTDKTDVYWVAALVAGRFRKLGIVMIAGADAPERIRGRRIFYRLLTWGEDITFRNDGSIGFSKPAYDYVKADGVRFIVTYATEARQMNVAHVNAFTYEWNKGQGLQKRAPVVDTEMFENSPGLKYPTEVRCVKIDDENPGGPEAPPTSSAPPPPAFQPRLPDPTTQGIKHKCGCTFVNNKIHTPCDKHKDMWRKAS